MMTEHNDNQIIVSISCITYNHAPYIRQCLDGFMMQRTNFAYEVLIHDDASTDGTTEIIKEYEAKYPDIIKPIYEDENQWVKGRRGSAVFNFPRAKGKYIALCEGDDYWTDPLKLQKQVDFLEAHEDFVMCSHTYQEYSQNAQLLQVGWKPEKSLEYDIIDLLKGYWYFHPLTVVFRRDSLDLRMYNRYPISMDAVLFYQLLKKGKGFLFEEEMGVYRLHDGGVWSSINSCSKMETEFMARFGIYEVDPCYDSAYFIKTQFFKPMNRKWMLNNIPILSRSIKIMIRHLGMWVTFKAIVKSIIISEKS